MRPEIDAHGLTDVGQRRQTNEDQFLIADLNKSLRVHCTSLRINDETRIYGGSQGTLLVVADGMGGEAGGERASTIAVDQIATYVLNSLSWCFRLEEHSDLDFQEHLKEALESCQRSIHRAGREQPELRRMGTTMTLVYLVWPRAFVVHVGDSRCYLLRDRELRQITADHTMAACMVSAGQMSPEAASHSSMRHALLNVLGGGAGELSVDVERLTLEVGDVLLLCTDGLYGMLSNDVLQGVIGSDHDAATMCHKLVDLANEKGGNDNITVVVARFLSRRKEELQAYIETEVPLIEITQPECSPLERSSRVVLDDGRVSLAFGGALGFRLRN